MYSINVIYKTLQLNKRFNICNPRGCFRKTFSSLWMSCMKSKYVKHFEFSIFINKSLVVRLSKQHIAKSIMQIQNMNPCSQIYTLLFVLSDKPMSLSLWPCCINHSPSSGCTFCCLETSILFGFLTWNLSFPGVQFLIDWHSVEAKNVWLSYLSCWNGKWKLIFHSEACLFLPGIRLPAGSRCQSVRRLTHLVCVRWRKQTLI